MMTSPVERVEVLVGVLILLSITYGKVSTVEVVEYMFVQSGESEAGEWGMRKRGHLEEGINMMCV